MFVHAKLPFDLIYRSMQLDTEDVVWMIALLQHVAYRLCLPLIFSLPTVECALHNDQVDSNGALPSFHQLYSALN
jgi:hypothetical protein